jgi:S-phase kinase-associated protein 1
MQFAEIPESCKDVDFKVFLVLKSSDGKCFKFSRNAAKSCKTLTRMLDDQNEDDEIKLPVDCDAKTLALVIQYCEYHKDSKPAALPQPLQKRIDDYLDSWDKNFIYDYLVIKGDERKHEALLDVMAAAHYFDNGDLLNLCCAKVASMIQDKKPEEIRDLFNLPDDFTPAQRARNVQELKALAEEFGSSFGAVAVTLSRTSPSSSLLLKIVFIQKVALFSTPETALKFVFVTRIWREAILEFSFHVLFQRLLPNNNSTAAVTSQEKKQDQAVVARVFDSLSFSLEEMQKILSQTSGFLPSNACLAQTGSPSASFLMQVLELVSFLAPLAHASTSTDLKSAVDPLPRHGKYSTEQVRDLLIAKKDLIVDAETADSVVKFLQSFSLNCLQVLVTKEFQEFIIDNIAPHVTAIEEFGRLISGIVQDQQSAEFFSNVESFSAILKCFHRSKASRDACWIASSIFKILYFNPSSNILLNSLPVVEAFSFIIPLADDAETVRCISKALVQVLVNNEEAHQKFEASEFFNIFRKMEKYAKAEESTVWSLWFRSAVDILNVIEQKKSLAGVDTSSLLKSAVDYLVSLPQNCLYYTEAIRNILIAKKEFIVDAETADSVVKFLFSFTQDESRRPLLRTKEVRDLIINTIAPHVTAIFEFGRLICNIVQNRQSAVLFSNAESFSAILKCFHLSKKSNDAYWMASCVNNILEYNPTSNILFNSLPVVEAFSFIIPLANKDLTVGGISLALLKILENNEEAQKKFGTAEFLEIFQGMEKDATTNESNTSFKSVSDILKNA